MGKNANALENLTFVITGATDERPRDEFGNYIQALVESHGGQMRGSISGRTDYLVCGTYHFNPFLGTVGTIENGSKYRKALEKGTRIIDGDMLVDIINGSGEV
ncbi:hypothetical protein TrLO_g4212 [Triparma laevis f. longispina]|uniref:BRCT domain-containing protein n=1 Tax=Triparma laevis f. longispina TaxID=1714387 RepID=A0A9W7KW74_9STRA|nr:hypothetical protein TrLO_g4212 [Triparma laevis f. longispina]